MAATGEREQAVKELLEAAEAYGDGDDHQGALSLYVKALKLDPRRLEVHLDIAFIESAMGRHEAARRRVEGLADVYMKQGRTEEAVELIRFATSWDPDEPARAPSDPTAATRSDSDDLDHTTVARAPRPPKTATTEQTVICATVLITPDGELMFPDRVLAEPEDEGSVRRRPRRARRILAEAPVDLSVPPRRPRPLAAAGVAVNDGDITVVRRPAPAIASPVALAGRSSDRPTAARQSAVSGFLESSSATSRAAVRRGPPPAYAAAPRRAQAPESGLVARRAQPATAGPAAVRRGPPIAPGPAAVRRAQPIAPGPAAPRHPQAAPELVVTRSNQLPAAPHRAPAVAARRGPVAARRDPDDAARRDSAVTVRSGRRSAAPRRSAQPSPRSTNIPAAGRRPAAEASARSVASNGKFRLDRAPRPGVKRETSDSPSGRSRSMSRRPERDDEITCRFRRPHDLKAAIDAATR